MRWRQRIRLEREGVSVAADVNAAIAVNHDLTGACQKVESASHVRVVQDSRPGQQGSGDGVPPENQEEPND
jgi:hypothetical protein